MRGSQIQRFPDKLAHQDQTNIKYGQDLAVGDNNVANPSSKFDFSF